MIGLETWFRARCNKLLCIQMMVVVALSAIWWAFQALPIAYAPFQSDELFFGTVDRAVQSRLFGRVSFRINDDDGAEFQIWMDGQNRQEFDQWFGPEVPLRIDARRLLGRDWLVVGLSSPYGQLNRETLARWRIRMGMLSLLCSLVSILGFTWLLHQYRSYFRYRSWWGSKHETL